MNPFQDYFSELYENIFDHIIKYCDISSIESLRVTYPHLHQVINNNLIELHSDTCNDHTTDFKYYNNCYNLECINDNIIFNIYHPYELLSLNELPKLNIINFYIKYKLNNEYETLEYLRNMLRVLSNKNFMCCTYRLIFKTTREYAYILDKGFFTIANFNQMRNYQILGVYRINWLRKVQQIIIDELPEVKIHECLYSRKKIKNLASNIELFDKHIHKKLPKGKNLVFLIKIDDYDEIYLIDEFTRRLLKSDIEDIDNEIFDDLKGVTREILEIIILKYGRQRKLFISKYDDLYFKVWHDELFKNHFPIKRDDFVKFNKLDLNDDSILQIIDQMIKGEITNENLINLMVNTLEPADTIKFSTLKRLYLPPHRSYTDINLKLDMLEFMIDKMSRLIDQF